jgi:ABC-type Fe3+-hydroxamate transport system substrate-binding protein
MSARPRRRISLVVGVTAAPRCRAGSLLVIVLLVTFVLTAGVAAALTVRDMLGRDVTLPALPRRIVSLVPSVTEDLFALGADDRLAGVTDYCDFPPAAKKKPSVGGMITPSLETIVTLKADLVIATRDGNREETFTDIQRLGIPVYLVRANRLADAIGLIGRLGELTGRPGAAGHIVQRMERRIEAVKNAVAPFARPRVLYVLWPEPLIVPGRDALVTELIQLAGGDSITAGEPDAYPRFSMEAAVARDPEIIVLANHGTGSGPIPAERWQRLASVSAVKAGRIRSADGNLLHRYGPRLVDGLEQLARELHPEAFR